VYNRHGIRLVFRQIGEIGIFNTQILLVNLVTAMGLIAVATTVVDLLMLNILPQKERYASAKTQEVEIPDVMDSSASVPAEDNLTFDRPRVNSREELNKSLLGGD
jgi:hypothetical protein